MDSRKLNQNDIFETLNNLLDNKKLLTVKDYSIFLILFNNSFKRRYHLEYGNLVERIVNIIRKKVVSKRNVDALFIRLNYLTQEKLAKLNSTNKEELIDEELDLKSDLKNFLNPIIDARTSLSLSIELADECDKIYEGIKIYNGEKRVSNFIPVSNLQNIEKIISENENNIFWKHDYFSTENEYLYINNNIKFLMNSFYIENCAYSGNDEDSIVYEFGITKKLISVVEEKIGTVLDFAKNEDMFEISFCDLFNMSALINVIKNDFITDRKILPFEVIAFQKKLMRIMAFNLFTDKIVLPKRIISFEMINEIATILSNKTYSNSFLNSNFSLFSYPAKKNMSLTDLKLFNGLNGKACGINQKIKKVEEIINLEKFEKFEDYEDFLKLTNDILMIYFDSFNSADMLYVIEMIRDSKNYKNIQANIKTPIQDFIDCKKDFENDILGKGLMQILKRTIEQFIEECRDIIIINFFNNVIENRNLSVEEFIKKVSGNKFKDYLSLDDIKIPIKVSFLKELIENPSVENLNKLKRMIK